jgi:endonuclease G
VREYIRRGGVSATEADDRTLEAIIGETRDFLPADFFRLGLAAAAAVGRVVVGPSSGRRGSLGTGFMVSPRLMLTNHHVLRDAEMAAASVLEMGYEERDGRTAVPQVFALRPGDFFLTVPELDFSLVAIAPGSVAGAPLSAHGFLPLIADEGKILLGDPVNIIQHPGGRAKQIVVRENRLLNLPSDPNWAAHYSADTERGSSGSPVLSDRWEVIALHHSGVPRTDDAGRWLDTDGRPWEENDDPARIDWIGNEGIRISRLVGAIAASRVKESEKRLREEVLNPPPRPAPEAATGAAPADARRPALRVSRRATEGAPAATLPASGEAVLSVPLTIRVSLGAPGAAIPTPGVVTGDLEKLEIDPDYDTREGFDGEFCGFPAPLPEPGETIEDDLATILEGPDEGAYELRYHRYSVIMNAARRLAFVSAVNIDGEAPALFERQGSDRWVFDPRIPEDAQAGNEFYAGNPLDRGHLTRRRDAAWGATDREAKQGNDDTFHWTNCAPQHEVFNQSDLATRRGLRLWGNLENHVLDAAQADGLRLSVFNGPVFRANDRNHRGLQVPREFFKVIAFRAGGTNRVLAFILSQGDLIRTLPQEALAEEALVPGPFHPFQVRLADVERRTGLGFAAPMHAADTLRGRRGAEEGLAEGEPLPLETLGGVVLAPTVQAAPQRRRKT